jgi:hypothetical protein
MLSSENRNKVKAVMDEELAKSKEFGGPSPSH